MNRVKHPNALLGQKVVTVIGGGFAGLSAAKYLANKENVFVVLIDERNHHLFQPLLYQVATAGLNPSDIAVPIRSQFANSKNVQVHLGKVEKINLHEMFVAVNEYEFESDYIVVACGTKHSYFKNPQWEELAPGLKTLEQAIEIRRRILLAFEEAENEIDSRKQRELLTFVIVGGGPTGVELAGAISDISRTVLINDFKRINPADARVLLIESGERLLSSFDERLSHRTLNDLTELGVEVKTQNLVENISPRGVVVNKVFIPARNVFWAAGVRATEMNFFPAVEKDPAGRIEVEKDFSIPHFPRAFVIGDMASMEIGEGKFLPGLAPAAMQAGTYVAKRIMQSIHVRSIQKDSNPRFIYKDKGMMATIGKNKAVAQTGSLRLTGRIAWLTWLFIHILYLIGFKNRIAVLAQWAWSYLFSKRGARLITLKEWKFSQEKVELRKIAQIDT